LNAAGDQLREAVRLDPNFALAASRLAQVYLLKVNNDLLTSKEGYALTRSQAQRALLIDPALAEPHLWLGYVYRTLDWNWAAAAAEFQQVLDADPTNVDAMMFSGTLYKTLAQWPAGEKVLRRAMELDPLNTYVLFNLGDLLYLSHRFPDAEAVFRRLRVSAPSFLWTRPRLAMTLLAEKRPKEALALFEEGGLSGHYNPWPSVLLANGRTAEADRLLQEQMGAKPITNAYYVAANLAYRNDADQAFQWLEKAYSQRDSSLVSDMTNEPFFANIRDDPRFTAFRRKMNLSE
jgi:tetratricopeptide (TPR) repeat protein